MIFTTYFASHFSAWHPASQLSVKDSKTPFLRTNYESPLAFLYYWSSHLKMYFSWLPWLLLTLAIYLSLVLFCFVLFLSWNASFFLKIDFFPLYFSNLWTVALVSPYFNLCEAFCITQHLKPKSILSPLSTHFPISWVAGP